MYPRVHAGVLVRTRAAAAIHFLNTWGREMSGKEKVFLVLSPSSNLTSRQGSWGNKSIDTSTRQQ
jgi:hypothetical protein